MIDRVSFSSRTSISSRTSVPNLLREDADDDTDEILIFEEDGETPTAFEVEDEDYDYGLGFAEDLPQGYSLKELEQVVTFVRSSKNPNTGDFEQESKTLLWCIENGCEEAQPGVWSGCWYFTYLFGEEEGKRAWIETRNKRLVKEGGGKARQVAQDDFTAMLRLKEKGKRAFNRGQYKTALDCFVKAEELLGGDVTGIYLVPHQRAAMVTLLSNQAECYLRLKKHEEAILQATKALQLDRRHSKSLLRRAKATISASDRHVLHSMAAASAAEDLHAIIEMKGEGAQEAQKLIDEISERRNASCARSEQ